MTLTKEELTIIWKALDFQQLSLYNLDSVLPEVSMATAHKTLRELRAKVVREYIGRGPTPQ